MNISKKLISLILLLPVFLSACSKDYVVVMGGIDPSVPQLSESFETRAENYQTQPDKAAMSGFNTYISYIYAAYQLRDFGKNWIPVIYEVYPTTPGLLPLPPSDPKYDADSDQSKREVIAYATKQRKIHADQMDSDLQAIKNFNGTKEDEARLLADLADRYGETFGHSKELNVWQEILTEYKDEYLDIIFDVEKANASIQKAMLLLISAGKIRAEAEYEYTAGSCLPLPSAVKYESTITPEILDWYRTTLGPDLFSQSTLYRYLPHK